MLDGHGGNHDARKKIRLIAEAEQLAERVKAAAAELGFQVTDDPGASPWIVDPLVGVEKIDALVPPDAVPERAAVIRRIAPMPAVFLALRRTDGTLIDDPRLDDRSLRAFLERTVVREEQKRRAYPRAQASGIELLHPPGAHIVDISPFGARVWVPTPTDELVRLRIEFRRLNRRVDVDADVAGTMETDERGAVLRLRFRAIAQDAQNELLKIAKAQLLCETVDAVFMRCEQLDVDGYRRLSRLPDRLRVLEQLRRTRSRLLFSRMHEGRALRGELTTIDPESRTVEVATRGVVLMQPGDYLRYTASANHDSYLLDGYVMDADPARLRLTLPSAVIISEHRAQERIPLGMESEVTVKVGDASYPVTDISSRGFAFHLPAEPSPVADATHIDVSFGLGPIETPVETVLVRNHRRVAAGHTVGAMFVDGQRIANPGPFTEESFEGTEADIDHVAKRWPAQPIRFPSGAPGANGRRRRVAGLWSRSEGGEGPTLLVVIPPAWAKTKESTSLLAQMLCASFEAHGRPVAVLRLDYTNALGESDRAEIFDRAGQEMLGLTFSACIEDIHAAVDHGLERIDGEARVALVGMSFSGPLCLRAAVTDDRVEALAEFMGASDIQDLVRNATGGIDYVGRYRSGLRSLHQNVLGVLSDTDRWARDALDNRLALLQDAHLDAARLRAPLLWVHGAFDAYVNEARLRGILRAASVERHLVVVPYGHVPTHSREAQLASIPLVRFLLRQSEPSLPADVRVVVPDDAQVQAEEAAEWARAPRTPLAAPTDYWRDYMLGQNEDALGFDVLTMTREYRDFMTLQIELLADQLEHPLHDLGAGTGHSLPTLARVAPHVPGAVLYDLVPDVLERARERAADEGIEVDTVTWNADTEAPPATLDTAYVVLMSLFLSCLPDPRRALERIFAALPTGAVVVASSIQPDADLSLIYARLLDDIAAGRVPAPPGYTRERFREEVRAYMNSAAWLLRLTEEGAFTLFERHEFEALFASVGFEISTVRTTFGTPPRAVVLRAEKPRG